MKRWLGSVFFSLLAVALVAVLAPGNTANEDLFRIAFSESVFANVNRNDALASAKVWIEAVGRRRGFEMEVQVLTYATQVELQRMLIEKEADLFVVTSMHFLDMAEGDPPWDPVFLPETGGSVVEEYLLLARSDRPHDLESLRDGELLMLSMACTGLAGQWTGQLLTSQDLGSTGSFFGSVTEVTKASGAILPVFFGQADACVVDRTSLDVMAELNPQLGRDLHVCATSPPFVETVLCLHQDYTQHRADVLEGLAELHEEPAGEQLMMVFRIDRLVPFDPHRLSSVRTLRDPSHLPLKAATQ